MGKAVPTYNKGTGIIKRWLVVYVMLEVNGLVGYTAERGAKKLSLDDIELLAQNVLAVMNGLNNDAALKVIERVTALLPAHSHVGFPITETTTAHT